MDEPLGTLDGERRTQLRDIIRAQQRALGVTTLYVTHDQEEAMTLADRVVVMDAGRIRQVGTPEAVYEEPADLFVADFVGSPGMNRLAGEIVAGAFQPAGGSPPIPLERAVRPGPAVLGVRSEYVLADDAAPLRGTVVLDEYLGAWRNVHLDTPGGRVVMRAAPDRRHRPGETLGLRFAPAHTLLFDAADGMRV
jgi:multiple sugar transport system ATP-binding protein